MQAGEMKTSLNAQNQLMVCMSVQLTVNSVSH